IERGEALVRRTARIADADAPRPIAAPAGDVHVAASLDHETAETPPPQDRHGAIDGIALSDAAEIDAHALAPEKRGPRRRVHLDVAIVDERQPAAHLLAVGNRVVLLLGVELPQAGQRPECDVERSAGPL